MNTMNQPPADLSRVVGVIFGAAIGGLIGWVIGEVLVYQLIEKKKAAEVENEEDYGSAYFKNDAQSEVPFNITSKRSSFEKKDGQVVINYAEKFKEGKLNRVPGNTFDLLDGEDDVDPDAEDVEIFEDEDDEEEEDMNGHPISLQDYMDSEFDKQTLEYYDKDHKVLFDDETILQNPENHLGWGFQEWFGEESEDIDTVFIENREDEVVYEVSRIHGSYDELILGYVPEDAPSRKKKKPAKVEEIEETDNDEVPATTRRRHRKSKAELDDETTEI